LSWNTRWPNDVSCANARSSDNNSVAAAITPENRIWALASALCSIVAVGSSFTSDPPMSSGITAVSTLATLRFFLDSSCRRRRPRDPHLAPRASNDSRSLPAKPGCINSSTKRTGIGDMVRPCIGAGRDSSACRLVGRSHSPCRSLKATLLALSRSKRPLSCWRMFAAAVQHGRLSKLV
jgi:hypothetical protein